MLLLECYHNSLRKSSEGQGEKVECRGFEFGLGLGLGLELGLGLG